MKAFIQTWGWTLLMPLVVVPAIVSTAYRRYRPAPPPKPLVETVSRPVEELFRRDLQAMAQEISSLRAELLARDRRDPVEVTVKGQHWLATNANNIGFQWLRTLSERRTNLPFGEYTFMPTERITNQIVYGYIDHLKNQ